MSEHCKVHAREMKAIMNCTMADGRQLEDGCENLRNCVQYFLAADQPQVLREALSSMSLSLAMVRVMIQNGEQDIPWKFERAPSPVDGWEELEDPVHPCVSLMRKEMEQAASFLLKHPGLHSQWHWLQRAMVIYLLK